MNIHVIHTGSTGNCYLVEYEPSKFFMLDCGVPGSMIVEYCKRHKVSLKDIKFCLISHLHGDHLYDASFINTFSIPVYFPKVEKDNDIQKTIFKNLITYIGMFVDKQFSPLQAPTLEIHPFVVPHDSYNFAYKILLPNGKKLIYMTDFGNIKDLPIYPDKIDYWLIECNYGVNTIGDGQIQRRSKSDTGHCSNEDCYEYLASQPKITQSQILLIHASADQLDPDSDYKVFRDLECKSIKPVKNFTKYELN